MTTTEIREAEGTVVWYRPAHARRRARVVVVGMIDALPGWVLVERLGTGRHIGVRENELEAG